VSLAEESGVAMEVVQPESPSMVNLREEEMAFGEALSEVWTSPKAPSQKMKAPLCLLPSSTSTAHGNLAGDALVPHMTVGGSSSSSAPALTADTLTQWERRGTQLDMLAASADAKHAQSSENQWHMVREQMSLLSEELLSLSSEMPSVHHKVDLECSDRIAMQEELTRRISQLEKGMQRTEPLSASDVSRFDELSASDVSRFDELAEKVQELRRELKAEKEARGVEIAAASCNWQNIKNLMLSNEQMLSNKMLKQFEDFRLDVKHEVKQHADSRIVSPSTRAELTQQLEKMQSSINLVEGQVETKCEEMARLAAALQTFSEKVSFQIKECDLESSRRFSKLSEEFAQERQERSEHIGDLRATFANCQSAHVDKHHSRKSSSYRHDGDTPGQVPGALWQSLHDEELLATHSSMGCIMVRQGLQDQINDLQEVSKSVNEVYGSQEHLQRRFDLECTKHAQTTEDFTEELKTLSWQITEVSASLTAQSKQCESKFVALEHRLKASPDANAMSRQIQEHDVTRHLRLLQEQFGAEREDRLKNFSDLIDASLQGHYATLEELRILRNAFDEVKAARADVVAERDARNIQSCAVQNVAGHLPKKVLASDHNLQRTAGGKSEEWALLSEALSLEIKCLYQSVMKEVDGLKSDILRVERQVAE
jgi:hypothetical protein